MTTGAEARDEFELSWFNIEHARRRPPASFSYLRFDPINDCNVHCVYCHNQRSKAVVDIESFRSFLFHNVVGVENFQIGCGMEPTLDRRLGELMLLIAGSPAKPTKTFTLQTNGILLHRHDYGVMREAGLTWLSVSVDTADAGALKLLRGGTSLRKVLANVASFHEQCPRVTIGFIATVTALNVDRTAELVQTGLDLGASHFTFREMFYDPDNTVVDHEQMRGLILKEGDFSRMRHTLLDRFGDRTALLFAERTWLEEENVRMNVRSLSFRES
jgi:molybdenum cofactor biosynthesis enzyme MoaA